MPSVDQKWKMDKDKYKPKIFRSTLPSRQKSIPIMLNNSFRKRGARGDLKT
jgi:hypothetical protein